MLDQLVEVELFWANVPPLSHAHSVKAKRSDYHNENALSAPGGSPPVRFVTMSRNCFPRSFVGLPAATIPVRSPCL